MIDPVDIAFRDGFGKQIVIMAAKFDASVGYVAVAGIIDYDADKGIEEKSFDSGDFCSRGAGGYQKGQAYQRDHNWKFMGYAGDGSGHGAVSFLIV